MRAGTVPLSARAESRPPRCPVCGARGGRVEGDLHRCDHCGLGRHASADGAARATRALRALLVPGPVDVGALAGTSPAGAPLAMDAYTLRTAAAGLGLGFEPADAAQREALARPHSTLPGRGRLAPFAPAAPRVALGTIVSADGAAAALARAHRLGAAFASAVVAIDADPDDGAIAGTILEAERADPVAGAPATTRGAAPIVIRHPLGGDFAAQRNRIQAASPAPWVLQLDADEDPDPVLLERMHALAAQADAHGLVSIGLPRRNLVDGAPADLWPDVQYRLNRREVRYAGRVHERPDLGGEWRLSMIAPGATLAHRLERARVLERSRRYEAMQGGAGRPGDEAALLRPFSP